MATCAMSREDECQIMIAKHANGDINLYAKTYLEFQDILREKYGSLLAAFKTDECYKVLDDIIDNKS